MTAGRFHLLLAVDGRPMMHGWWASEATARGRFRDWIGERGSMSGARVTLTDEGTGETLAGWPDEARPGIVGGGA